MVFEQRPFTRREFLGTALTAIFALLFPKLFSKQQTLSPFRSPILDSNYDTTIGLLTDVHAREINHGTLACTLALPSLKLLVEMLKPLKLDFFVSMGDLIHDGLSEIDSLNMMTECLATIEALKTVAIIEGNHDDWALVEALIRLARQEAGVDDRYYGVEDFGHFQIVWINLFAGRGSHGIIPAETIRWLMNLPRKRTILVSHYPIHQPHTVGPYFQDHPNHAVIGNWQEVRAAIHDLPVGLVLSGHLHHPFHEIIGDTHYVSLESFSDRIVQRDNDEHPGIYHIGSFGRDGFKITTYNRHDILRVVEEKFLV